MRARVIRRGPARGREQLMCMEERAKAERLTHALKDARLSSVGMARCSYFLPEKAEINLDSIQSHGLRTSPMVKYLLADSCESGWQEGPRSSKVVTVCCL